MTLYFILTNTTTMDSMLVFADVRVYTLICTNTWILYFPYQWNNQTSACMTTLFCERKPAQVAPCKPLVTTYSARGQNVGNSGVFSVKCIQQVCVNVRLNAKTSSLLGTLGKLSSTLWQRRLNLAGDIRGWADQAALGSARQFLLRALKPHVTYLKTRSCLNTCQYKLDRLSFYHL